MRVNAQQRFSELDDDAYMLLCLDKLSNASKNGIEVRCIFCEKCSKPFFDENFD